MGNMANMHSMAIHTSKEANEMKEKELIVLSLAAGMGTGEQALKELKINTKVYASETDKYAIQILKKNHPEVILIGNMLKLKVEGNKFGFIDLIMAGTPCQGFSRAGKGLNFKDPRSKLFFEFSRILKEAKEINPKIKFLFENVSMKQEWQDVISEQLGVKPIKINSALVSGQTRTRLYWTNIENVTIPKDRSIYLNSILENGEVDRDKSYCLDANYFKGTNVKQYISKSRRQIVWVIPEATKKGYVEVSEGECIDLSFIKSKTRRGRLMLKKSNCLTAQPGTYCKVTKEWFRMLTPLEMERLQTLPDNYTEGVSNTQRKKMIGNGWTLEVIKHILKNLK